MKSEFFDNRLRFNTAAFYYDYKDLQVGLITGPGVSTVQNAAAARIYGLDLDLVADRSPDAARLGEFPEHQVQELQQRADIPAAQTSDVPGAGRDANGCPLASIQANVVDGSGAAAIAARPKLNGSCSYSLNVSGLDLIFSPKFSANFGADYDLPIGRSRLVLCGSVYYNDGYDIVPGGLFAHVDRCRRAR